MKECSKCHKFKNLEEFSKHPRGIMGVNPACKACKNEQAAAYYQNNRELIKERTKGRDQHGTAIKRRFGLTSVDYQDLLELQDHKCAICGGVDSNRRLAVDHDHVTGLVRGLLCLRCNQALGLFKDNPLTLAKAIDYLG